MNEQKNLALQAFKIFCLTADKYYEMGDELTKAYVGPQIQGAKNIIATMIEATYPEPGVVPAPSEEAANDTDQ